MKIIYKRKLKQDLRTDAEQQDDALQTMLDWKKSETREFSASLRLYLSVRRLLRHIQKSRPLIVTLAAGIAAPGKILVLI